MFTVETIKDMRKLFPTLNLTLLQAKTLYEKLFYNVSRSLAPLHPSHAQIEATVNEAVKTLSLFVQWPMPAEASSEDQPLTPQESRCIPR